MWSGVDSGLAQGVVLGVEEAGAEVLGLADDRRERHPVQDVPHLLRDGVERAADDLQGDRVKFPVGHGLLLFVPWAPALVRRSAQVRRTCRLPYSLTSAA